jgi:radical SAM protein with 4Fe4S-binding SPASM domain
MELPQELSYVKVVPSYECAKACFYCYNTLLGQSSMPAHGAITDILLSILDSATSPLSVEIIGGEPLEPPALKFTLQTLERARAHDRCDQIFLSTALASPRLLSQVAPLVDLIYLSIDMARDERNKKSVSLVRLQRVLRAIRDGGSDVALSVVIFGTETDAEIVAFVDLLIEAGVSSVGMAHQSATRLSQAEVSRVVAIYHLLFKLRLTRAAEITISGTMLDSIELSLLGGSRTGACECARYSVVIEPDARVVPGVCTDHALAPISPTVLLEGRPEQLQAGACGSCPLWDVCKGGCATEALRFSGDAAKRAPIHCAVMLGLSSAVSRDVESIPSPRVGSAEPLG